MLITLPAELFYRIVAFFPTASCITNLARTCRHLYRVISADNYRIFQAFIQGQFPSFETPPIWKDAARALCSQTRAFVRREQVARLVLPDRNAVRIGNPVTTRTDRPTLGYRPVIDSYETWHADRWFARKEVLAWGAGADLVLRIKRFGRQARRGLPTGNRDELDRSDTSSYDGAQWVIFSALPTVNSHDDIAGVHLLGARGIQQPGPGDREDLILGRYNGDVVQLSISPSDASSSIQKRFDTGQRRLDYTNISTQGDRMLAVSLEKQSIAFYKTDSEADIIQPFGEINGLSSDHVGHSCSQFLNDKSFAVGVNDKQNNHISIYDFAPDRIKCLRDISIPHEKTWRRTGNPTVNVLAPLSAAPTNGIQRGEIYLSGWQDSIIRVHDLRAPDSSVLVFFDSVDDNPIYSILPIGHERFLTGSGDNSLLKIYDMRVPDEIVDSFSCGPHRSESKIRIGNIRQTRRNEPYSKIRKGLNMFFPRVEAPRGRRNTFRVVEENYNRSPIYALSQPSPSSSTIYVGTEDNVSRLDFICKDDLLRNSWNKWNLSSPLKRNIASEYQPFALSTYERPWNEDQASGVKLTRQQPFW
ncbi:hypothetical protein FQN57_000522 [Myotisia sp. PD_48]|nr:hypothetical protein FQN57_000522 [Myotisia sp. PD_48]